MNGNQILQQLWALAGDAHRKSEMRDPAVVTVREDDESLPSPPLFEKGSEIREL